MAAAKARFWAGGSSSESESENESSSDEEVIAPKTTGGKFGMTYESDSGRLGFLPLFPPFFLTDHRV
jgi:hypothetical protein